MNRPHLFSVITIALFGAAVSSSLSAAEITASYPVGGPCIGGCPAEDFTVTTDGGLRAEVAVTSACIAATVRFRVDGIEAFTSDPVLPGSSTGVVDLGPVTPGTRTLTVEAEVPVSIECDSISWSGTLRVTTTGVTHDDVVLVHPGDQATASAPGITATLDRSRVSATSAVARLSVATYDGPPPGSPGNPYQPGDPYFPNDPYVVGYVDLQLTNADRGDVIAGEFYPVDPIFPNDPIFPTDPLYPTDPVIPNDPVQLAYWLGDAWSPVLSSAGSLPGYDSVTNRLFVTFDASSAPSVTELSGTVFAIIPSVYFRGFGIPVSPGTMNVARAGRAIPLKWQIFAPTLDPIANLDPAIVKISSVMIPCAASNGLSDAVDEYATGKSGLQNLGDGNYQLNWATSKGYAGTCRQLRLDLGERNPDGTPFYRTADFHFTR